MIRTLAHSPTHRRPPSAVKEKLRAAGPRVTQPVMWGPDLTRLQLKPSGRDGPPPTAVSFLMPLGKRTGESRCGMLTSPPPEPLNYLSIQRLPASHADHSEAPKTGAERAFWVAMGAEGGAQGQEGVISNHQRLPICFLT